MNQNKINIEEHLLLNYLLGRATPAEKATIEEWLGEKEENRKHLEQLESLWAEAGKLTPVPLAVDTEAAWQKVSHRIRRPGRVILMQSILSAAAIVLFSIGIYLVYRFIYSGKQQIELTTIDQIVSDTLPDGTVVTLNEMSNLTYTAPGRKDIREARLFGEAVFRVSKTDGKPFIVVTERAFVKVLGTTFHVVAHPGEATSVSVDEGTVLFFTVKSPPGDTISLLMQAGDRAVLETGSERPELDKTVNPGELYWYNKSFVFNETTLAEAFKMLKDHFEIDVVVKNPDILQCRLTSTFVNESPEAIMKVISETFNLSLDIENKTYFLSGNGCSRVIP